MERGNATGGVRRVAASDDCRDQNRVLVIQDSTDHREAMVFRAHTAPQGTCDNLINALKLLTKPTERWWQSSCDNCSRFVGKKSQQNKWTGFGSSLQ